MDKYINKIVQGDCLEKLKELSDNSVDSICTDPPYELGFMGKSWDSTGVANNVEMWGECLRVLKPGGYLLAFSGTRTYHRMASAIEDAGFEVRDMIEWIYGSGFPKSLNIGKAVDRLQGNEREVVGENQDILTKQAKDIREGKRKIVDSFNAGSPKRNNGFKTISAETTKGTSEWEGWGTALKPSHEPICMARKPLAEKTVAENVLKYGTGGINIDESRVETKDKLQVLHGTFTFGGGLGADVKGKKIEFIDSGLGRFPANLIHDNSEEVRECFPDAGKGNGKGAYNYAGREYNNKDTSMFNGDKPQAPSNFNDSGNASRFFRAIPQENIGERKSFKSIIYQAKASKSERNKGMDYLEAKEWKQENSPNPNRKERPFLPVKNNHPTVKPIALMEYLIKMITPKGGIVLDPFAGSGSTLVAAKQNGFKYIGIELTEEYIPIIEARLNYTNPHFTFL